jgi:hypothetical protein
MGSSVLTNAVRSSGSKASCVCVHTSAYVSIRQHASAYKCGEVFEVESQLYVCSIQALLRLYYGSIQALFRSYSGSIQALFRLY